MERRHFLTLSASAVGGVLVFSLDRKVSRISAEGGTLRVALRFFTESEAQIVTAATSRIFPSDESGPGANEAGVVIYIDRQLAGPYGADCRRYTHPPFEEDGPPDFGYQGRANPREIYREGLKEIQGFDGLPPAEQDEALRLIESTRFFRLLRQHTIEGMFCDPMHGGNIGMIGWQMTGFPGPQMSYYNDIDTHYGEAFRPKPVRLSGGTPDEDQPC